MCLKALISHSEDEVHVCDMLNHSHSLLFCGFLGLEAVRQPAFESFKKLHSYSVLLGSQDTVPYVLSMMQGLLLSGNSLFKVLL